MGDSETSRETVLQQGVEVMRWLISMGATAMVLCGLACSEAWAGEDLEVAIVFYRAGHYVAPINNKIVVADRPFPFYVMVKNTSDRDTELYEKKGSLNPRHLEFEFVDAGGMKTVVRHKEATSTRARGYRMMKSGERIIASVLLHEGEWGNMPELPTDKESEFTVRLMYVNNRKKISSVAYKVTVKVM